MIASENIISDLATDNPLKDNLNQHPVENEMDNKNIINELNTDPVLNAPNPDSLELNVPNPDSPEECVASYNFKQTLTFYDDNNANMGIPANELNPETICLNALDHLVSESNLIPKTIKNELYSKMEADHPITDNNNDARSVTSDVTLKRPKTEIAELVSTSVSLINHQQPSSQGTVEIKISVVTQKFKQNMPAVALLPGVNSLGDTGAGTECVSLKLVEGLDWTLFP